MKTLTMSDLESAVKRKVVFRAGRKGDVYEGPLQRELRIGYYIPRGESRHYLSTGNTVKMKRGETYETVHIGILVTPETFEKFF